MDSHREEVFIGRQPILDRRNRIVAFELLFRQGGSDKADVVDDTHASAQVISNAFGNLGIGSALGSCACYVNVGRELLLSDAIELLPRDSVTLELLETVEADQEVVARCRDLRALGYRLALDDYEDGGANEPLLALADVVKIDLMSLGVSNAVDFGERIRSRRKGAPLTLLAEKVERWQEHSFLRSSGYELFQGFFFARPHHLVARRVEASPLSMLRLLELLLSDAEGREIEHALKHEPALCYGLFRLANSAARSGGRQVSSIREAIVMLGRHQLRRWLQLLFYAQGREDGSGRALMQLAAMRGRLMETLSGYVHGDSREWQEKAFATGIFSMVDLLLDLPMEEIVGQVHLNSEIEGALLRREGPLGELLRLCEALDAEEEWGGQDSAIGPGFDTTMLLQAQAEAMQWANNMSRALE